LCNTYGNERQSPAPSRALEWFDEQGLTWLDAAPKIKLLQVTGGRDRYRLKFDEQARLFRELPVHLSPMALFKVNTGCREQEVCKLKWEWESKCGLAGAKPVRSSHPSV
jgi:integrase